MRFTYDDAARLFPCEECGVQPGQCCESACGRRIFGTHFRRRAAAAAARRDSPSSFYVIGLQGARSVSFAVYPNESEELTDERPFRPRSL